MSEDRSRQLRAVLRNALTWAAAWGIAGGAIATVLTLFGVGTGIESLLERIGVLEHHPAGLPGPAPGRYQPGAFHPAGCGCRGSGCAPLPAVDECADRRTSDRVGIGHGRRRLGDGVRRRRGRDRKS